MIRPTYEQQWQKITEAYMRDEIEPYIPCGCFIGNLLNRNDEWEEARHINDPTSEYAECTPKSRSSSLYSARGFRAIKEQSGGLYDIKDICRMEEVFLRVFNSKQDEQSLFNAMNITLEVLRQIHEAKGDPTAKPITLNKRVLCAS